MEKIRGFFRTLWKIITFPFIWAFSKLWSLIRMALVRIFGTSYTRVETNVSDFWFHRIRAPYRAFRRKHPWPGRIVGFGLNLFVLLLAYWFVLETNFLYLTGETPSTEELANPNLAVASEIYTADGKPLGRFFTENRTPVRNFEELPKHTVEALIATEDARFYEHGGIDWPAMGRVAFGVITGNQRGGGSTITQQVAKNLFKIRKKTGIARKGLLGSIPVVGLFVIKSKEWLTALKLERQYSKDEILLMYFNTVDFGSNTYGIRTASRVYFGKQPQELSVQEGAVLVGLQKATTTYNPYINPERSKERRNVVLAQMAKYGYLTEPQADSIARLDLGVRTDREKALQEEEAIGYEGYFKKYIAEAVAKWAESNDERIDLYTDGLKIYTTIDSRMQADAIKALVGNMRQTQREFKNHLGSRNPWIYENGQEIPNFLDSAMKRTEAYKALAKRFPGQPDSIRYYLTKVKHPVRVFAWNDKAKEGDPQITRRQEEFTSMDSLGYYKRMLQAGMMAMDPQTGYIKAWVGGLDYNYFKYDHVRQAKRQPGSTFKPIMYCAAIDGPRDLSPCYTVRDQPFTKEYEENGEKKRWSPQNAEGYFTYREMTLREAMARSINSVAAQVTDLVTPDTVSQYAHKLGIKSRIQAVPSVGLGSEDVSLYEMVEAYSAFINGGYRIEPQLILRIEGRDGEIIADFKDMAVKNRTQVIRPESAFLLRNMLQGGVSGGGTSSRLLWQFSPKGVSRQTLYDSFGGKTGTTSNYSDGWFMGVTSDLVTGVWVGGDDRSIHFKGRRGEGAQTALPIYKDFMLRMLNSGAYTLKPFPTAEEMNLSISKEYKSCQSYYAPIQSDTTNYFENDSLEDLFAPPTIDIRPDSLNL
ncbi:transglycosylase domain-containing protein [Siphonobacter sp. SORGH_AS_0500]|uniref:penicillin-binding protein 1A n=1 Tax=Siphonobacter sp. SORGH_AS_0500 TaxID=1864824 RepID=UPI0028648D7C|nr:transglycosylase domain-containing protein [Siphonobacter sp. SORGH_AS_0500]MDR6194589.1 penicillin-binding protein 1A [Siphonobacter sp. SORGH_AS_0500]